MSDQKVPAVAADEPADAHVSPANTDCPICSYVGADESDVYVHLQTSHRKSTIAAAVVEGETPQAVTHLE